MKKIYFQIFSSMKEEINPTAGNLVDRDSDLAEDMAVATRQILRGISSFILKNGGFLFRPSIHWIVLNKNYYLVIYLNRQILRQFVTNTEGFDGP